MALSDGKHVMLSYHWKSQKIVSQVYDILKAENIPVWLDIQGGMKDNLYKSMAAAVENAAVVCCFMSPEYQESENCQLELTYAQAQHKRIIACIVTDKKDWKPSDWLGLITSRLLHINFKDVSEEGIRLKSKELVDRIKEQSAFQESTNFEYVGVAVDEVEEGIKDLHLRTPTHAHNLSKTHTYSHKHHKGHTHPHTNTHSHHHPQSQTHSPTTSHTHPS